MAPLWAIRQNLDRSRPALRSLVQQNQYEFGLCLTEAQASLAIPGCEGAFKPWLLSQHIPRATAYRLINRFAERSQLSTEPSDFSETVCGRRLPPRSSAGTIAVECRNTHLAAARGASLALVSISGPLPGKELRRAASAPQPAAAARRPRQLRAAAGSREESRAGAITLSHLRRVIALWAVRRKLDRSRPALRYLIQQNDDDLGLCLTQAQASLAVPGRCGAFRAWLCTQHIPRATAYRLITRYADRRKPAPKPNRFTETVSGFASASLVTGSPFKIRCADPQ